jgi:hypothetical protein
VPVGCNLYDDRYMHNNVCRVMRFELFRFCRICNLGSKSSNTGLNIVQWELHRLTMGVFEVQRESWFFCRVVP